MSYFMKYKKGLVSSNKKLRQRGIKKIAAQKRFGKVVRKAIPINMVK